MHGFSGLYPIVMFVSVAAPKHRQRDRRTGTEGQGQRERDIL